MGKVLVIFLTLCLTNCTGIEYTDVSAEGRYQNIIGGKYRTTKDLMIHAVGLDLPNRDYNNRPIDYYVVTDWPGIGGREILSRKVLKIGTMFVVKHVTSCVNCLFDDRIQVIIEIFSKEYEGQYIKLRFPEMFAPAQDPEKIELNADYFQGVD